MGKATNLFWGQQNECRLGLDVLDGISVTSQQAPILKAGVQAY